MTPRSRRVQSRRSHYRTRVARLPRPAAVGRFVRHLREPTRSSAVRAVVDGALVTWTLRRRGVRPLLSTPDGRPARPDPDQSIRVADAVDIGFALIPVAPTCLRRSITLVRELHRLGLASTLHIGVRRIDERLEAHAWVQVGVVVVNDDDEEIATYTGLAEGELERLLPLLR
jgi:Transglutaminase-like superfamily